MEEFELEPGEKVLSSVRQHIVVLFFQLLPFILLALVPVVFFGALSSSLFSSAQFFEIQQSVRNIDLQSYLVRFLFGIYLLFLWMCIFTVLTRYFLTVWIITSTRIVSINQYGFFRRQVSSFLLVRVQDVTTAVHGIFATLFGYGDLHVETAGRDENFSMFGVKDPVGVRDLIMREVAILHADGSPNSSGI